MEVILTTITLTTLVIVAIVIGTKYRESLSDNRGPILLLASSAAMVIAFIYFFYFTPGKKIGVEQPIPFSHRVHVGVKEIQFQFCHPYVGRSTHP